MKKTMFIISLIMVAIFFCTPVISMPANPVTTGQKISATINVYVYYKNVHGPVASAYVSINGIPCGTTNQLGLTSVKVYPQQDGSTYSLTAQKDLYNGAASVFIEPGEIKFVTISVSRINESFQSSMSFI